MIWESMFTMPRCLKRRSGELKPDIVIVTTLSLLKDVYDVLMVCAENGINAITTCEEAIYPWNSSPELTRKLDETAKKTGGNDNRCGSAGSAVVFDGE